ncbi:MAG: OmpA family protein [Cyclobacteriaceae bacterium]
MGLPKIYYSLSVTVLLSIYISVNCFAQLKKAKDQYPNGQLKYQGKYIRCSYPDPKVNGLIINEERKTGKWTAYYPNGQAKEIRYYTSGIKNCDQPVYKTGNWLYYNEDGIPYLTESYRKDTLISAFIDIYRKNEKVGTVMRSDVQPEMLYTTFTEDTLNLIPNPDFEMYFFPPVDLRADGKDPIHDKIPYWKSPDSYNSHTGTPDYYHKARMIEGVPRNPGIATDNGYTGLMLYLNTESDKNPLMMNDSRRDYKESLQVKLKEKLLPQSIYCFTMQIRLSPLSGYAIDQLSVSLSPSPVRFSVFGAMPQPAFTINQLPDDTSDWTTLCKTFNSGDLEHQYLTIGRYAGSQELTVIQKQPSAISALDINRSAYYYVDDFSLTYVNNVTECGCRNLKNEYYLIDNNPQENLPYILPDIRFKFNSSKLIDRYNGSLRELRDNLLQQPDWSIHITGHTDNTGTQARNHQLSLERAEAVADWLIKAGIDKNRIKTTGKGAQMPIDHVNKALNRRVEIVFFQE